VKARSEPTTHNRKRPQSGTVDTVDTEDTRGHAHAAAALRPVLGAGCRVAPLLYLSARPLSAVGSRCTAPQRHTATQRTSVAGWDLSLSWSSLLAWSLFR
jgi:hypothetical protein